MTAEFKSIGDNLFVNSDGLIWSEHSHKFLKTSERATVRYKGDNVRAYRLIASAFCKHPKGADVVHHINGDYNDNRAENLMWVTPEQHAAIHTEWMRLFKKLQNDLAHQTMVHAIALTSE